MANEKFKINGIVSEVVPVVGTTGDILKKTASGVEWGSLGKKDVGLSSVPNYSVASQSDAEAGTSDIRLMTPLRVKQAIDKLTPAPAKATHTTDGLMTSADKTKLDGIETGAQKNTVTKVQGRTGAVTITKSDVGLGSVNNVAITQAQVTKLDQLNYTKALTQAQYNALSTTEKNRTDVWYGIYRE